MMSIGECARCGKPIMVPHDVVVWADDRSFHRHCHEAQLVVDIAQQVSRRQAAPTAAPTPSPLAEPAEV